MYNYKIGIFEISFNIKAWLLLPSVALDLEEDEIIIGLFCFLIVIEV